MLKEQYPITFNKMELLDIEKALNLLVETEGDTVYYTALEKVRNTLDEVGWE